MPFTEVINRLKHTPIMLKRLKKLLPDTAEKIIYLLNITGLVLLPHV